MSLTSKQIDELRAYAKDRKGQLAKLINDAADTIEMLSAKLHASQMERSSQYYHGGWILCSERLPKEEGWYITTIENEKTGRRRIENDLFAIGIAEAHGNTPYKFCKDGYRQKTIAWMPLPEPYRGEGEK